MTERKINTIMTIDERIDFHRQLLNEHIKQLENCNTSGRETIEKEKSKEEQIIETLIIKRNSLLSMPKFLFLIADEKQNKVIESISTYIETADEAKRFVVRIMEKLLEDNQVKMKLGNYIGIIVRKAFYEKMAEKETVSAIFNNRDTYVTSQIFVVTDNGVAFL